MLQIIEITSEPKQKHLLVIEGYEDKAELTLEYKPNQYAWYFGLIWGDFNIQNRRIVRSPNILRQFRNLIPFGIQIYTRNEMDPATEDEFTGGNTEFYLLDADEVEEIETQIYE